MEALLVKIFATALALSQVMTTPSAVRTEFDRERDQPQVAKILNAGCAHMLKVFELVFGLFRRHERGHFPFCSRFGAEFLYCLGLAGT